MMPSLDSDPLLHFGLPLLSNAFSDYLRRVCHPEMFSLLIYPNVRQCVSRGIALPSNVAGLDLNGLVTP